MFHSRCWMARNAAWEAVRGADAGFSTRFRVFLVVWKGLIVMPTPRLPTAMHIAKGTYKKDPQRAKARENEPVVTEGIGAPPSCWMPDESGYQSSDSKKLIVLWHEFIADAAPGVLNRSHRSVLEEACRLKLKTRNGSAKTGDRSNYINCLRQMGMTPAAQSTVSGGAFTPAGSTSTIGRLAAQAHSRRAG